MFNSRQPHRTPLPWLLLLALAVGTPARATDGALPLNLDEVHYFLSHRAAALRFFEQNFGARLMLHPGRRPLEFIDILNLRPGEPSINISPKGPYPGMAVSDPKRWQRNVVAPDRGRLPVYGVYWLGLRTSSLESALTRLTSNGVALRSRSLALPGEPRARAALVYGPDENLFAIVERKEPADARFPFGFDHVQLLVQNAALNERFFSEVYAGRTLSRGPGFVVMDVAGARLVLSEPEALGLKRRAVRPRDPDEFRYEVDHVSFLYAKVQPAYEAASALGHRFPLEPRPLAYFGEPTPYVFGFTFSPDGLQCEMLSEEGRVGPRRLVDEREFVSRPDPAALPWQPLGGPGLPAGLEARVLRESALGPRTLIVRYPPGFKLDSGARSSDVELFVLDGELLAGPQSLRKGHYAFVPAHSETPAVASPAGATVLEYWSGPPDLATLSTGARSAPGPEPFVIDSEQVPWASSTVTQPGRPAIPLLIRRLRTDAATGARTWLVAVLRGVRVPWEVHSTPEEGFLVEGDYVQPECLPGGPVSSAYVPGGYFWRPARVWHSGPGESTKAYAIWLLRTPRSLDVEFADDCKPQAAH